MPEVCRRSVAPRPSGTTSTSAGACNREACRRAARTIARAGKARLPRPRASPGVSPWVERDCAPPALVDGRNGGRAHHETFDSLERVAAREVRSASTGWLWTRAAMRARSARRAAFGILPLVAIGLFEPLSHA